MTLKSDTKFEEKLTLGSKNDIMKWVNFNASSGKSKNVHIDEVLLLSIAFKVSLMTLKKDPNFKEKLTFFKKNDMKNGTY